MDTVQEQRCGRGHELVPGQADSRIAEDASLDRDPESVDTWSTSPEYTTAAHSVVPPPSIVLAGSAASPRVEPDVASPVSGPPRVPDATARSFGFARSDSDIEFSNSEFTHTKAPLAERYKILHKIAEGGMGVIYLVTERISGRAVALKVMKESAIEDRSLVQQFVREAVIAARLQHPGVVPVYELGFLTGEELYYTMRFVEGSPFTSYIREQTFSLSNRLQVLRQAALGVDHAHAAGLWHRDVKPGNILVGKHGEVHVIDWGLVSVQRGKQYRLTLPKLRLRNRTVHFEGVDLLLAKTDAALSTQSGVFAGTPQYMAPEQLARIDDTMGPRSDIWSFGVMLYEAIAERHPFGPSTEHVLDMIDAVKHRPHPPLQLLAPSAPPKLVALCDKMLEKHPERRLSSLSEFASELDRSRVMSAEPLTILPTTIATSNSPHIATILANHHRQREELAIRRELDATSLLRWRTRRQLRRRLAALRAEPEIHAPM